MRRCRTITDCDVPLLLLVLATSATGTAAPTATITTSTSESATTTGSVSHLDEEFCRGSQYICQMNDRSSAEQAISTPEPCPLASESTVLPVCVEQDGILTVLRSRSSSGLLSAHAIED